MKAATALSAHLDAFLLALCQDGVLELLQLLQLRVPLLQRLLLVLAQLLCFCLLGQLQLLALLPVKRCLLRQRQRLGRNGWEGLGVG